MKGGQALPSVEVRVDGKLRRALVDTGCTQSMLAAESGEEGGEKGVQTVDGRVISGVGEKDVEMEVDGRRMVVKCLVMPSLVEDFKVIIGMDVITRISGVVVNGSGVRFGAAAAAAAAVSVKEKAEVVEINDKDFEARFDGEKWTIGWKWKGEAPVLTNRVSKYAMSAPVEQRFDEELDKWKAEGWLRPCEAPVHGLIPLMAVEQPSKGKIRPVMDFRELNKHVESYTGDSDVCSATTRKWRKMDGKPRVLDLRNAYLQLHVRQDLQQFQTVQHKGQHYELTRLGFGLNCAPKVMTAVLAKVLSMDPEINEATDHYVDDIIVNEDLVDLERVVKHLQRYGLETKPPERIEEARVLGLQLQSVPGVGLLWRRGSELPDVDAERMTRRELFSICGKLIGHYPVAGWLRVACSFMKRNSEGTTWEDEIGDKVRGWLKDVLRRLREKDPARGAWKAATDGDCKVWCDASSLAVGVVIEMSGKVVEDASWLRKKDDGAHINVAELDAVLKGINLALKWDVKSMVLYTDSATVNGWLRSLLTGSQRVKVSGIAEMLVRRRLAMVAELRDVYGLDITVELVRSEANKSDELTRVPQAWLRAERPRTSLEALHGRHHFGVRRTLHFAKQVDPTATRADVEKVVRACRDCASVDPAPTQWDKGELSVAQNWQRLAADVTHYGNERYLTMVDCGPSRFAIWRRINTESAGEITALFEQVFRERGPPSELLLDNSATFRSQQMDDLCSRWCIFRGFRCAYRPSGNGIVERNHRTIKSLATRSGKTPSEMVFWYNSAPLDDAAGTVPVEAVYSYVVRNPDVQGERNERQAEENRYTVGDMVFVKPAAARCTTRWAEGVVTGVTSSTCVEVDGMPRHVADCRHVPMEPPYEADAADDAADGAMEPAPEPPPPRRSERTRRPPVRYSEVE